MARAGLNRSKTAGGVEEDADRADAPGEEGAAGLAQAVPAAARAEGRQGPAGRRGAAEVTRLCLVRPLACSCLAADGLLLILSCNTVASNKIKLTERGTAITIEMYSTMEIILFAYTCRYSCTAIFL